MTNESGCNNLERTAAHWGEQAGEWSVGRGRNWFEVPDVQTRINTLISGQENVDLYQWLIEKLLKRGLSTPFDNVLTLGCGAGDLERGLFGLGFAHHYEGMDVSAPAIERARAAAALLPNADIRYTITDINTVSLEANRYDVIFCIMSAHHFSGLERIFGEVQRALKPGGVFALNEYIGPKQFQWTSQQVGLIDTLLRNVPERYVRLSQGEFRRSFVSPTVAEVVAVDPTEAIRSDEILSVLAQHFVVTEFKGYGGSLLHGLLDHIGINFIDNDPESTAMLKTFFALEDWALENRILEHDFAVIMAERPQDLGCPPGMSGIQVGRSIFRTELGRVELALPLTESEQRRELAALNSQLMAIKSSRSWRITAPLRRISSWLGRLKALITGVNG